MRKMTAEEKRRHRKNTVKLMKRHWVLYIFLIPALLYLATFNYGPMYGLMIAFKNFKASKGIWGSEWAGLKWFETFFSTPRFLDILKNTLTISLYSLVFDFPLPIILALILNNVKNLKWKKFAQTVTYMPHFISVVVLVSMMSIFFSPNSGMINTLLKYLGGSGETYFMGNAQYFPHMYVWSGIWQSMGWGSIIYIAALAGVDPSLHESAMLDGANKFKRVLHIDLPTIMPTMAIMLIMRCGSIMNIGYEKVYLMQNSLNIATSEVISTYVYKIGLQQQQFSYSTAIGLFNSVVNFILLLIVNKTDDKLSGSSLF